MRAFLAVFALVAFSYVNCQSFEEVDTNKDKMWSLSEWKAVFMKYDVDGNGGVTPDEVSKVAKITMTEGKAAIGRYDFNKDGKITMDEGMKVFAMFDLNGDKSVTHVEFMTMMKKMQAQVVG